MDVSDKIKDAAARAKQAAAEQKENSEDAARRTQERGAERGAQVREHIHAPHKGEQT